MKVKNVPQGKAFITYNSDEYQKNIFIKINDNLFFHAMYFNENNKWQEMKSNFAYNYNQVVHNNDKANIITLDHIPNNRLQKCLKYIFTKMRA